MGSRGGRHLLALGEKKFNENGAFLEAGAPEFFSLEMLFCMK